MDFKVFESLGLNEKSAALYLAGLTLGTTSVRELARKAGLKRPTTYLYLDELIRRGYFEAVPAGKKTYYETVPPEKIEKRFEQNLDALKRELPKLAAMRSDTMGRPQTRVLEGVEGVTEIYKELRKASNWRIWSNIGDVYAPFHDTYMQLCESAKDNGITVREIIGDTREARRYSRLIAKIAGPTYTGRLAVVDGLMNDSIIYGNVVALFRLSGFNQFVVRIEDKTIADSMRALFDMAWKTARPFR